MIYANVFFFQSQKPFQKKITGPIMNPGFFT